MEARPFPGSPHMFNMIFSKELYNAALELDKHDSQRSKQMAEIYEGLSLCLLAPRAYFDLFMRIGPYYQEMQEFWNHKVYVENGGVLGSKKDMFMEVDKISTDLSIVNDLPAQPFNLLMGLLAFTQDETAISNIPHVNDELREQITIFNQMIWAIYMGAFKPDYFAKNLEVVVKSGKEAQRELNASRTDVN